MGGVQGTATAAKCDYGWRTVSEARCLKYLKAMIREGNVR